MPIIKPKPLPTIQIGINIKDEELIPDNWDELENELFADLDKNTTNSTNSRNTHQTNILSDIGVNRSNVAPNDSRAEKIIVPKPCPAIKIESAPKKQAVFVDSLEELEDLD